jgi:hypothetical protein
VAKRARGIGAHHSPVMQKDEWLTPPEIILALGAFDLEFAFLSCSLAAVVVGLV